MSQYTGSSLKGQCIAEFLGTGLIIFLGVGGVAALKLAGATFGQWEIAMLWGVAISMAIYLSAGVSGGHLNPAVTLALWMFANFEGRRVVAYIIAQVAGAFCAAAVVYWLYHNLFFDYEQLHHIVPGSMESLELAGVFSTYPNPHISVGHAFMEAVITAVLMVLIMALTDDGNGLPKGPLAPLLIGLLVAVIGASMGPLTGFALNPARDFGPKLFASLIGWGELALTGARDIPYFLVPIFGPILGAGIGAFAYRNLISRHLLVDVSETQQQSVSQAE